MKTIFDAIRVVEDIRDEDPDDSSTEWDEGWHAALDAVEMRLRAALDDDGEGGGS